MKHLLLRSFARALPLLLLTLALPHPAAAQPPAPATPHPAPGARARLAQAAGATQLAPWQRDLMQRLARGDEPTALDEPATVEAADLPASAADVADGSWAPLVVGAREEHTAIYDPLRDRMVVFGGYDNSGSFGDVWALSLAGTPVWTLLTPTGTPPTARYGHSTIYDPVRDRLVVFGGGASSGYANDVWALSLAGTPAWTLLAPAGTPPTGRHGHSAIYDPVRDRMVVFGGTSSEVPSGNFNDVWALSLAGTPAWTQLTPTGTPPVPRTEHSAVLDPARDRMVVFGGVSGSYHGDVWALSLGEASAWTQLAPTGTPPTARYGHSMIHDPVRDRIVVFGGYDGAYPEPYRNDVWTLSLGEASAWTELAPAGTPPSARSDASAIYDPVRDRLVLFGGDYWSYEAWNTWHNDVEALGLAGMPGWTTLTASSPSLRAWHSAIYDPVRDRMVVFGSAYIAITNDVWALSLTGTPAWTELAPTGIPLSARLRHSAVYDPVRDRMIVFGGIYPDGSTYFNDVRAVSFAGSPAWTAVAPIGTPPSARCSHTAIYDPVRDRMLVFGGDDGSSALNDVWELSLATRTWAQLAPTGTPPGVRAGHCAIYDPVRDRMVIFGGRGATGRLDDVWSLSLAGTPAWEALAPAGTPPGTRDGQSAVYDPVRDRMVVFGGYPTPSLTNEVWALSLAGTPAWTPLAPAGTQPSARWSHSAIYDPLNDRMVVFAGRAADYSDYNDVWALGWSTAAGVDGARPLAPAGFIGPPAPNPSRGWIALRYSVARAGRVQLDVFDASGRRVRRLVDRESAGGADAVSWDGTTDSGAKLGAGVYFVRLVGPGTGTARRIVLLK